jgi:GxxExxY protein
VRDRAFDNDLLTEKVIGVAIEVHRQLGPGLLESAYEECLCCELARAQVLSQRQVALPVIYKSVRLDCGYRLDLVVENRLIVELKTVERLMPIHEAQVITYLRLSGIPTGLLLNFNSVVLKHGIRRLMLSGCTESRDLTVSPSHCD